MTVFEDMTAFVQVVEAESFSEAARRLGVAKSVVSRRVGTLETRLGASLFHRTTRRLSLTEVGHAYYERSQRILADVSEADDVAGHLQTALTGKLRIAAPMTFGIRHLSSAVADFLKLHPEVDIELELNDRRVDLVSEGYDLAVRIGKLPDSSLIARTLAPCRHLVCASPAYLSERGHPTTPADLATEAHDCLVYSNRPVGDQWRFLVEGNWEPIKVRPRRLGVNNGEVLQTALLAGIGLASLPTFLVGDAIRRGELISVLSGFPIESPDIHAIWPPSRQLSAKVRALVDFFGGRFGPDPYWDRDCEAP